jgi:CarboxypepD_reg-like domain
VPPGETNKNKMKINKYIPTILLVLISSSLFSQTSIKGRVRGENNISLVGVKIVVKGTSLGTVSDQQGNYKIFAPSQGTLAFSYPNYETQEILINNAIEINVLLFKKLDIVISSHNSLTQGLLNNVQVLEKDVIKKTKYLDNKLRYNPQQDKRKWMFWDWHFYKTPLNRIDLNAISNADRDIDDVFLKLYQKSVTDSIDGYPQLTEIALNHYCTILRRKCSASYHTEVPELENESICKGDIVLDQFLKNYFDDLFVDVDHEEKIRKLLTDIKEISRQSICISDRQMFYLCQNMVSSYDDLSIFLSKNKLDEVKPFVVNALTQPFVLFYDIEKSRIPSSPLKDWFKDNSKWIYAGIENDRLPLLWHGLWLYDNISGGLIGRTHDTTSILENVVDLRHFFFALNSPFNLGDHSCSFTEMIEYGKTDIGYLCGLGNPCTDINNSNLFNTFKKIARNEDSLKLVLCDLFQQKIINRNKLENIEEKLQNPNLRFSGNGREFISQLSCFSLIYGNHQTVYQKFIKCNYDAIGLANLGEPPTPIVFRGYLLPSCALANSNGERDGDLEAAEAKESVRKEDEKFIRDLTDEIDKLSKDLKDLNKQLDNINNVSDFNITLTSGGIEVGAMLSTAYAQVVNLCLYINDFPLSYGEIVELDIQHLKNIIKDKEDIQESENDFFEKKYGYDAIKKYRDHQGKGYRCDGPCSNCTAHGNQIAEGTLNCIDSGGSSPLQDEFFEKSCWFDDPKCKQSKEQKLNDCISTTSQTIKNSIVARKCALVLCASSRYSYITQFGDCGCGGEIVGGINNDPLRDFCTHALCLNSSNFSYITNENKCGCGDTKFQFPSNLPNPKPPRFQPFIKVWFNGFLKEKIKKH